jgi:nucleotide-binding universal stress UspA family protein
MACALHFEVDMKLDPILVGVDFSEPCEDALAAAASVARHVGGRVVLVHAVPLPDMPIVQAQLLAPAEGVADPSVLDSARRALDELRERIAGQGVEVSAVCVESSPADAIVEAADEHDAGLVVVGSHGRTGLRRIALGSVAEKVVRQCERPVLVARPRSGGDEGFRRVVVATDFSEHAERAVTFALALAAPGGEVVALHCWYLAEMAGRYAPTMTEPGAVGDSLRDAILGAAKERGAELLARHRGAAVPLRFATVEAPPAQGIQDWLDRNPADLCVVGSHGRRGLRRLLLGSVAEKTVRHASCSVAVVR